MAVKRMLQKEINYLVPTSARNNEKVSGSD